jgi:hypothetical protein
MKGEDYVIIGLILVLLLGLFTIDVHADSLKNQALKECLHKHGFIPGQTHVQQYDWNKASSCVDKKHIALEEDKIRKEKAFLDQNPWYTGKNWNWDDNAKENYMCERIYSTQLVNTITVCHRPFFIN